MITLSKNIGFIHEKWCLCKSKNNSEILVPLRVKISQTMQTIFKHLLPTKFQFIFQILRAIRK